MHRQLIAVFAQGIEALRKGNTPGARQLLNFPEPAEIGFGYAKSGKKGSGVGEYLTELIIDSLNSSDELLARGIRHIEELQLLSMGIGPDRISDISANILKGYLIQYTQKQCDLWNIRMEKGVPVHHFLDGANERWIDGHFDLPVSPIDHSPLLFVPRRIVRSLPWINYADFARSSFAAIHRAKATKSKLDFTSQQLGIETAKQSLVSVSRKELSRIDNYIANKVSSSALAQPSAEYIENDEICVESTTLSGKLRAVTIGVADASKYQRLILEAMNFLFSPELIDGELEVRTLDGTERRDIIFTNDSDKTFWSYVRAEHSNILLMCETKNTQAIEHAHINQTAGYLGDRLGRLGFIVTRTEPQEAIQRKINSVYNDSSPRKIILVLSDKDIHQMLDQKCKGLDPMRHIQRLYREFRQRVQ